MDAGIPFVPTKKLNTLHHHLAGGHCTGLASIDLGRLCTSVCVILVVTNTRPVEVDYTLLMTCTVLLCMHELRCVRIARAVVLRAPRISFLVPPRAINVPIITFSILITIFYSKFSIK